MSDPKNDIVVGVDGSAAGDAALCWALSHAAVSGEHVTAVRAWQLPPMIGPGDAFLSGVDESELEQGEKALLEEALARAAARVTGGSAIVNSVVVAGSAGQVLETRARDASMLVVGRRNESRGLSAIFGSTVSGLLHHAACPVVVVPVEAHAATQTGRIVVAVADGQASGGALTWAARTAAALHRPLVAVFVRPPDPGPTHDGFAGAADLDDVALKHLRELVVEAAPDLPMPAAADVLVGEPGPELVRYAAADDLLVVGSRGRGELTGRFLGSTSHHVVREAHCPVVVVRDSSG
jgi:nucleotide-binding universal stress UspA family protein